MILKDQTRKIFLRSNNPAPYHIFGKVLIKQIQNMSGMVVGTTAAGLPLVRVDKLFNQKPLAIHPKHLKIIEDK